MSKFDHVMRHFINHTEENYLKAIYALTEQSEKGVSTNSIAKILNTKASSVTEMMKKLSDKELVSYKKYYGVELTNKGRTIALTTIRKHRLWEVFLVDQLSFNWDEVHEIAEQLEHIQSEELTNRLDDFLGNPKFDPHGDPIPNSKGKIEDHRKKTTLSELNDGAVSTLVGVSDSSSLFLQHLEKRNLKLGTTIEIVNHFEFDRSLSILVNGSEQNISQRVADNLIVQPK